MNHFESSFLRSSVLIPNEKLFPIAIQLTGLFFFFQMADSSDLDNDIDELLQEFESSKNRPILHTVQFY